MGLSEYLRIMHSSLLVILILILYCTECPRALTTESEVLAPENLLGTMSSEITTEAPQVSTEMWFGKGTICITRIFLVYKLNMSPLEYECICMDICHEDSEERDEVANERRKDALKEIYGAHYDVRTYLYGVLIGIGVLGNILVLITVIKVMPMNVTNIYLANLAFADLLVIVICVPFKILEEVYMEWDFGEIACKAFGGLYFGTFMCSVFTLCCISLERYMAICHPMRSQFSRTIARTVKICVAVWLLGIAFSSPSYYFFNLHRGNVCLVGEMGNDGLDTRFYFYLYLLCIIFFLPAVLMGFAYFRTSLSLWRSIAVQRSLKSTDKKSKSNNSDTSRLQIIRMLIIVLVTFILCWGPYLLAQVIYNTEYFEYDLSIDRQHDLNNAMRYFVLMSMANSAMNPILYGLFSRAFRDGFVRCITCGKRRLIPAASYVTTTRNTNVSTTNASTAREASTVDVEKGKGSIKKNESKEQMAMSPV